MDELCSASSVLDAMAAEGPNVFELRAELFESALRLVAKEEVPRKEVVRLLGKAIDEVSLRCGLEETLRRLARLEPDRSRRLPWSIAPIGSDRSRGLEVPAHDLPILRRRAVG